ncbi:MAG: hypothetical protein KAT32_01870 [Candidatus Moranbacteria bacterium]|nr:hypothetical protein [Candidatus Moranbacteria bacterium]
MKKQSEFAENCDKITELKKKIKRVENPVEKNKLKIELHRLERSQNKITALV